MKVENIEVFGWKKAIEGMRRSYNSLNKIDSVFGVKSNVIIGDTDKELILKLARGGESHRKFMRCVHIQADITAPLYWWTEMDTYKVATVRLSSSTMHTIAKKNATLSDFEFDEHGQIEKSILNFVNTRIDEYNQKPSVQNLRKIKQILPSSYLYNCTFDFNYENFLEMYKFRHNHKLIEWHKFINIIIMNTPMTKEIINAIYGTTEAGRI